MEIASLRVYPFCLKTHLKGHPLREGLVLEAIDFQGTAHYAEVSPLPGWSHSYRSWR